VNACLALGCWVVLGGLPDATDAVANRLALRIAAQPSVVAAVTARLAPRLEAQGIVLDVTSVPEVDIDRVLELPPDDRPDAPLARGWLDGRDIDSAVLLLIPRRSDRVVIRKVPLMLGVDEVGLAEITFIIERSMASLRASEPIGLPHAEARAAVSAALPASSSAGAALAAPNALGLRLGVFGGVSSWSSTSLLVPRVGLDLWIDRVMGGGRVGLAASAAVDPEFHSTDGDGDLLVRAVALHASATAVRRFGRSGMGRIAAGPGLLVTRITPTLATSSPTDKIAAAPRTDLDPVIGLVARWDLRIGQTTSLFVAATVDIVLLRAQYTETVNGVDRVLFSPWPVRPGLVLGVSTGSDRR
jgi:hypothetical protein